MPVLLLQSLDMGLPVCPDPDNFDFNLYYSEQKKVESSHSSPPFRLIRRLRVY